MRQLRLAVLSCSNKLYKCFCCVRTLCLTLRKTHTTILQLNYCSYYNYVSDLKIAEGKTIQAANDNRLYLM